MPFTIVDKPPPERAPYMLVRYPVLRPGVAPAEPPAVNPDADFYVPYDQVAPGLYKDETVYRLETGDLVAVSARSKRDPSGGGMKFRGWARVIEEDGSTMRDRHGAEMELSHSFPIDAGMFNRLDEDGQAETKISREIMLAMLGEPPTMIPCEVNPDAPVREVATDNGDYERNPHKAPPGTIFNPDATETQLIGWSAEVRENVSIRFALKMFARSSPEIDVAAVLAKE